MTIKQFFGMITDSDRVIGEVLAEPAMSAGYEPGMRWLAISQAAWKGALLALSWVFLGVLALAVAGLGLERGFWGSSVLNAFISELSPFAIVVDVGLGVLSLGLAFLAGAHATDWLMHRVCARKPGRQAAAFNILIQAMTPLSLLLLVPGVGWLLLLPLALVNKVRALRHLYGERDLVKRVMVALVAWTFMCAVGLAAALPLRFAASPILRLDPLRGLERSLKEVLYSSGKAASAPAEPAMDAKALEDLAKALKD